MTRNFQTQLARDLFALGLEMTLAAHPEIPPYDHRPVTLPIADPKTIADEVQRVGAIHRHEYRGRPGEI